MDSETRNRLLDLEASNIALRKTIRLLASIAFVNRADELRELRDSIIGGEWSLPAEWDGSDEATQRYISVAKATIEDALSPYNTSTSD